MNNDIKDIVDDAKMMVSGEDVDVGQEGDEEENTSTTQDNETLESEQAGVAQGGQNKELVSTSYEEEIEDKEAWTEEDWEAQWLPFAPGQPLAPQVPPLVVCCLRGSQQT